MAISAAEQFMLELINRARLDPLGEAARHGIDLNQSLSPGYLHGGIRGVLAPEHALETAAIGHSQWMLSQDIFSHTGVSDSSPAERAIAAGYEGWGAGENISWRGTTGYLNLETTIAQQHSDLFLSASHRVNILYDSYREVGLAQEAGQFLYSGVNYNASMVTQNFSSQPDVFYVTGVVYDDVNRDRFYSIGEGRSGAQFSTLGDATTSASAGGYALKAVEGGLVSVRGTVGARDFHLKIMVQDVNAKLDIVGGQWAFSSADVTLVSGLQKARLLGLGSIDATGNRWANVLEGNNARNVLSGMAGNDQLLGQGGYDALFGGDGQDRLSGGLGNDLLRGGAGHDVLVGDGGQDRLYGEAGDDALTGGAGADCFVFGFGAGDDVITDFTSLDALHLNARLWGGVASSAAQVVAQYAEEIAGDVVINLGQGYSVTLAGVASLSGLADQIILI